MNIEQQFDILYPILNKISPISNESWDAAKVFFKTKTLKQTKTVMLEMFFYSSPHP